MHGHVITLFQSDVSTLTVLDEGGPISDSNLLEAVSTEFTTLLYFTHLLLDLLGYIP